MQSPEPLKVEKGDKRESKPERDKAEEEHREILSMWRILLTVFAFEV